MSKFTTLQLNQSFIKLAFSILINYEWQITDAYSEPSQKHKIECLTAFMIDHFYKTLHLKCLTGFYDRVCSVLSCFSMVLQGIFTKVDIYQPDYCFHSKLRSFLFLKSYTEVQYST